MTRQQSLKLAYAQDESSRKKALALQRWEHELDEQIEAALRRIELAMPGLDGRKWLAEETTDDEKPVSVSTVYDWLSRRNGRRPPAEVIAAIYKADDQFAAWWNATLGYEAPKRHCPLTLEQENALLRLALEEFGGPGKLKLKEIERARPSEVASG